ncbi:MAG: tetratricopeptide repeat protein [Chlorobi bacterium]|nr:tetratricopeptide repeat protein [Chlorobiota bacterium]
MLTERLTVNIKPGKTVLFICFLFFVFLAKAETNKLDSLIQKIGIVHGLEKYETLEKIVDIYYTKSPTKAVYYAMLSSKLAGQIKNKPLQAKALSNLGKAYFLKSKYDSSVYFYKRANQLYKELNDKKGISACCNYIGGIYGYTGNYQEAISLLQKSIAIDKEINDSLAMSQSLNNIGVVYFYWEDYEKAIEYYKKAMNIQVALKDSIKIATALNNIGEAMYYLNDFTNALKMCYNSLDISRKINSKDNIAITYDYIGNIYKSLKEYKTAIKFYKLSVSMSRSYEDWRSVAVTNTNIGELYLKQNRVDSAIIYFNNALTQAKTINYVTTVIDNYKNLSKAYQKKGKYKQALNYYKKHSILKDSVFNKESRDKLQELQLKYKREKQEKEIHQKDTEIEKVQNKLRIQRTIIYFFIIGLLIIILFSVLLNKQVKQKQKANYILNLQKKEIQEKTTVLETVNLELEKLSIAISETTNAITIMDSKGSFLWVNKGFTKLYELNIEELRLTRGKNIFECTNDPAILMSLRNCIKKKVAIDYEFTTITKTGKKVQVQTTITPVLSKEGNIKNLISIDTDISKLKNAEKEIIKQKNEISRKTNEITESILYSKTIQTALFPTNEIARKILPQSFIINMPKDIIGGDFFWLTEKEGYKIIAVADCTGHGIPGALMSMLGISFLNEIVLNKNIINTGKIIDNLREKIIQSLHQNVSEESSREGMDIAVCAIDVNNKTLNYSGANNSIIIIRKEKIIELSPDKMAVRWQQNKNKPFTVKTENLVDGDAIFMFTDGFSDQFGGYNNTKFRKQQMKELFKEVASLKPALQKETIIERFNHWKKGEEQIDDIFILGFSV